jgi:staphylococcal nuclease domain-containing protein 1
MGRRAIIESASETEGNTEERNGDTSVESRAPLTSAQRLAVSAASSAEVSPDPFGAEAKYFTELRVLNRDVCNLLL